MISINYEINRSQLARCFCLIFLLWKIHFDTDNMKGLEIRLPTEGTWILEISKRWERSWHGQPVRGANQSPNTLVLLNWQKLYEASEFRQRLESLPWLPPKRPTRPKLCTVHCSKCDAAFSTFIHECFTAFSTFDPGSLSGMFPRKVFSTRLCRTELETIEAWSHVSVGISIQSHIQSSSKMWYHAIIEDTTHSSVVNQILETLNRFEEPSSFKFLWQINKILCLVWTTSFKCVLPQTM